MSEYYEIIRKHAVLNRLKHGKAEPKAIMGKVISEAPKAKKNIKPLMKEIKYVVESVNETPLEILQKYSPERKKKKKKAESTLPELDEVKDDVILRFAPNPNGPATLGSARGIIVNFELAEKYRGKFILRFDDTDPKTKKPLAEAYGWYLDDCEWLGAYPDEVIYASEKLSLYYEYGERLINLNKAYICFCKRGEFKEYKDAKKICPHRNKKTKDNLKDWYDMMEGKYREGECVLRIKTDMKHKDPAIRDWVAFRIVKGEHPRVGRRFIIWPTLDFESAIEDHVLGVTHIIRGKDLIDSERRQKYIYDYFGWIYPKTKHWGRIKIDEFGKFSTSKLKKGIEEGLYSGWDDPQIPTIMSLRKRGISKDAIRKAILDLNIGENDINLSLKNIYAENRKILDSQVNRYFFVADPIPLKVKSAPNMVVEIPLHPRYPNRGLRKYNLKKEKNKIMNFFISEEDAKNLKKGDELRLKSAFNLKITKAGDEKIEGEYLKKKKLEVPIIHWVKDYVEALMIKPDELVSGYIETACSDIRLDTVVQFERYGFARLDSRDTASGETKHVFYYAHP
ncbi:MAG: glutamate--tRNA ligase [Candidatus Altiarchaeales archaeon ex4484_96]|nr:MAG: glutamate--tRNA ligase [Candidatus Altiarchaeales archaeon ex4484_96]